MTQSQATLTIDSLRGEGRTKGLCKVGRVIGKLCPEDQATLSDALFGPEEEFPSGRIVTALARLGINLTRDTVIKHRRGFCACNPSRR